MQSCFVFILIKLLLKVDFVMYCFLLAHNIKKKILICVLNVFNILRFCEAYF